MSNDYAIGYGKPPRHARFTKGVSGNPKGRPRKSRTTLGQDLESAFAERIGITVAGRERSMTMKELIVKQLMERARRGDKRAFKAMLDLREDVEKHGELSPIIIRMDEDDVKLC